MMATTYQAMSAAIRAAVPAETEVFALATFPKSLPFYLQRTMTLVIVKDEIEISIMQEPGRWIGSLDEFRTRWDAADQLMRGASRPARADHCQSGCDA